jgi:hypothetical protein
MIKLFEKRGFIGFKTKDRKSRDMLDMSKEDLLNVQRLDYCHDSENFSDDELKILRDQLIHAKKLEYLRLHYMPCDYKIFLPNGNSLRELIVYFKNGEKNNFKRLHFNCQNQIYKMLLGNVRDIASVGEFANLKTLTLQDSDFDLSLAPNLEELFLGINPTADISKSPALKRVNFTNSVPFDLSSFTINPDQFANPQLFSHKEFNGTMLAVPGLFNWQKAMTLQNTIVEEFAYTTWHRNFRMDEFLEKADVLRGFTSAGFVDELVGKHSENYSDDRAILAKTTIFEWIRKTFGDKIAVGVRDNFIK